MRTNSNRRKRYLRMESRPWLTPMMLVRRLVTLRQVFLRQLVDRRASPHFVVNSGVRIDRFGSNHPIPVQLLKRATLQREQISRAEFHRIDKSTVKADVHRHRIFSVPERTTTISSHLVISRTHFVRTEQPTFSVPSSPVVRSSLSPLPAVKKLSALPELRRATSEAERKSAESKQADFHPKIDAANTARLILHDHELDRITERVIGTIDRRIVADRERFGRI